MWDVAPSTQRRTSLDALPPSYALPDVTKIPRFRNFNAREFGCKLWWIEYGGRRDTVHDAEEIKWELWRVVYGVWNHIKNSGEFPEAENLTLEWVGQIPGKRESRRFEGDYVLNQRDIVEQRRHDDAVAFGGWSIDLHPADGVFSEKPGCNQWHAKGVYQIPYRCLYSRNVTNLFLAGRIISASHVAFGSSRVMATVAHAGQAVGMAAALCARTGALPAALSSGASLRTLQLELQRSGQHIPHVVLPDADDLVAKATITTSSRLKLAEIPADGPPLQLAQSWAMLLPLPAGPVPRFTFRVGAKRPTELRFELRTSSRVGNHTPDVTLASRTVAVPAGEDGRVSVQFDAALDEPQYAFVCLMANDAVRVRCSEQRVSGVLSVTNKFNPAVAKNSRQTPPEDIGVDAFEFWPAERRPGGRNFAMRIDPPLDGFGPDSVRNGVARPTVAANAWVADPADPSPTMSLNWDASAKVGRIELSFDADYDHPAESVLMGHRESVMLFDMRDYQVRCCNGTVLADVRGNHQTRNTIRLAQPVATGRLTIHLSHPGPNVPAALFEIRCYAE